MPVVDSRLYQVVYHGHGVLWETSYIDTEMRKDILSLSVIKTNLPEIEYFCHHVEKKKSVFCFWCHA